MLELDTYFQKNQYALKDKIVFAGSSLMEAFPLEELFLEKKIIVYNRGISGATSQAYLEVFDQLILPLRPKKILINIGSNDLAYENGKVSQLIDNYRTIFEKVKESLPGCDVTFIKFYRVNPKVMKETALVRKEEWLYRAAKYRTNTRLIQASDLISQIAALYDYDTFDVNEQLTDAHNQLDASLTNDGIHLTRDAYLRIFPMIYQKVVAQ